MVKQGLDSVGILNQKFDSVMFTNWNNRKKILRVARNLWILCSFGEKLLEFEFPFYSKGEWLLSFELIKFEFCSELKKF